MIDFSELFYIDTTSPSGLRWKLDRYKGKNHAQKFISKGNVAGCKNGSGYYQVTIGSKIFLAHRVVYQIKYGAINDKNLVIDHIDRNKVNNSPENLRLVSKSLNQRNRNISSQSSYGITGVHISHIKKSDHTYFNSYWIEIDGKESKKSFSILKYGLMPAFKMAIEHRENKLKELNQQGAGYTEHHGK